MAYNINVAPWMTGSDAMAAATRQRGEADATKIRSRNKGLETAAGLLLTAGSAGALGPGVEGALTGVGTNALIGGLMGANPSAGAMQGIGNYMSANAGNSDSFAYTGGEGGLLGKNQRKARGFDVEDMLSRLSGGF